MILSSAIDVGMDTGHRPEYPGFEVGEMGENRMTKANMGGVNNDSRGRSLMMS